MREAPWSAARRGGPRRNSLRNCGSYPSADEHTETMKMAAVAIVGPRRCLGPRAMRRIAATILKAAIFRANEAAEHAATALALT